MSEKQGNAQVEQTQLIKQNLVITKKIATQEHSTSMHLQNTRTKTLEMLFTEILNKKTTKRLRLNLRNKPNKLIYRQTTSKKFP
jgi:hypothetical protein